ncbi:MAG: Gfo/Idh/MocA family protein [Pirellulales bacterium]
MSYLTDRRRFLQTSALTGVGVFVSGTAAAESTSPNERIRFACIGIGGKGRADSSDAKRWADIVAICDVDDATLEKAGSTSFPSAARYSDFRKLLDEMAKSIDAVTVSIPDHMHAPATAMAMRLGKACYTQKPLTRTIWEARRLGEIARETGVATQMGNQGTSFPGLRKTVAALQAGVVGKPQAVHVWTNRPTWAQGGSRPPETAVPPSVHWDLWLGPRPHRPYGPGYHPHAWRGWWDFGSGALGDMACHTLNMPFWALNLRNPTSVVAESSGHNRDSYPKWSVINYEFPADGERPALTLTWYDGGKLPAPDLFGKEPVPRSGVLVVGDKDSLLARGDYCETGYKLTSGAEQPKIDYQASPGHFKELVDAIRGGPAARSNFADYASPLTETVLLANAAVWCANEPGTQGKKIEWDAKSLQATNAPEVAELVHPTFREGYTV